MPTWWVAVRLLLLLLLLLTLADFAVSENFLTRWFEREFPTYHVHIINGIDSPVWCECNSGDDDLEDQKLRENEELHFQFRADVLKYTVFGCECRWPRGRRHAYFDVFNAAKHSSDPLHCFGSQDCFWRIDEDGISASHDGSKSYIDLMQYWERA